MRPLDFSSAPKMPSIDRSSMRTLFGAFKLKNIVQHAQIALAQRQSLINSTDLVIAVIGAPGSGKSSIIGAMTGNDGAVQHDLQSSNDGSIKIVTFEGVERSDQRIVFIDTPGFDPTSQSERDLLKKIENCLPKACTLAAILSLQKISDNRLPEKYLTNISHYRTLCGTKDLHKVHLVTTMWNEVDEFAGPEIETTLMKEHWRVTIGQHASVHRYLCTAASAWSIVKECIEKSNSQFDNKVDYDIADLKGKILEVGAKNSRGDFEQLKALYQTRRTLLASIRAAVIRGETRDQWAHMRAQLDALHIQLCEAGGRLRQVPKLSSSFTAHLHQITSGSLAWGRG